MLDRMDITFDAPTVILPSDKRVCEGLCATVRRIRLWNEFTIEVSHVVLTSIRA